MLDNIKNSIRNNITNHRIVWITAMGVLFLLLLCDEMWLITLHIIIVFSALFYKIKTNKSAWDQPLLVIGVGLGLFGGIWGHNTEVVALVVVYGSFLCLFGSCIAYEMSQVWKQYATNAREIICMLWLGFITVFPLLSNALCQRGSDLVLNLVLLGLFLLSACCISALAAWIRKRCSQITEAILYIVLPVVTLLLLVIDEIWYPVKSLTGSIIFSSLFFFSLSYIATGIFQLRQRCKTYHQMVVYIILPTFLSLYLNNWITLYIETVSDAIYLMAILYCFGHSILYAIFQLGERNIKPSVLVILLLFSICSYGQVLPPLEHSRHYVEFLVQKTFYIPAINQIKAGTTYQTWEIRQDGGFRNVENSIVYDASDEVLKKDGIYGKERWTRFGRDEQTLVYHVYTLEGHFYLLRRWFET